MLYNYNKFCLVLERNLIKKIKKFANIPEIYDWSHEMDNNLSVWIADKLVNEIKNSLSRDVDKVNLNNIELLLKTGKPENDMILFKLKTEIIKAKAKLREPITKILHYVNSPLHEIKPNITKLSLEESLKLTNDWHKEIESGDKVIENESGEIIMTFPDGFYWIDTQTTKCEEEAESMGHCGNTNAGTTILSLRKNKQPHVTVAWNENDNITTQIKGKGNKKPIDKYHTYIVDLICKLECVRHKSEYSRSTDFLPEDLNEELFDKLNNCNPTYIENTKPADIADLKEMYKEEIKGNLSEYIDMYPQVFWNHMDDDRFIKDHIESEKEYFLSDFQNYFDKEDLTYWLKNNQPDGLEEWLKENDDDEGLDSEGKEKDLDELLDDCDIFNLFDHFNLDEEYCEYEANNRYDRSSAQEIHEEMYGSKELRYEEVKYLLNYLDEDAFATELSDYEDEDYLRERYDE